MRNIFAAENCVLKDEQKGLWAEEKYEIIKEYLKNKPLYDECKKEMLEIYEKDILNGDM